MKEISVASDIIPVGEFKAGLSKWLKNMQQTGCSIVITQNGRPAGVLVSPESFDKLRHTKRFSDSVIKEIADSDSGKVYDTLQVRKKLQEKRQNRERRDFPERMSLSQSHL